MTRLSGVAFVCLSMFLMVGCERPSASGGSGVVHDSAGVRIVDLPRSPAVPARWLQVDSAWLSSRSLEFGSLGDVAPLPDGGAVVLDEMSGTISVLAPEGELVLQFGGLGEGPGEFSPHGGISRVVVTDSSLLVPDIQLQRITEFSLEGAVLSIVPMPEPGPDHGPVFGVEWRAHPGQGIAFRALARAGDVILGASEQGVDTLHVFEPLDPTPNRLLPPTPIWDLDGEVRVLVGRSDRGQIEARTPGEASPIWIARWAGGAREISDGERTHLEGLLLSSAEAQGIGTLPADQRDRILRSVTLPDSVPVMASILADPAGRIWVQKAAAITDMGMEAMRVGMAAGFGGSEWWVFERNGLLREVVSLPRGFSPRRFAGGCMYGILADEMGVQRPARVCPEAPVPT